MSEYAKALDMVTMLNLCGHQAFIVGGAVRDLQLGLSPKDFDIATSALPSDIVSSLWDYNPKPIEAAQAYPIIVASGIEVATFRSDMPGATRNNLAAMKVGATILDDCFRRDFTFNGLYQGRYGDVIDPSGLGLSDLREGLIRFLGDPFERLREDPLRAMRGVRFKAKFAYLGFDYEENTRKALEQFKLYFRS